MKGLSLFLLLLVLMLPSSISANTVIKNTQQISLERRLNDWPEWRLPGPFNRRALNQEIVYPSWFNGSWIVQSSDLNDPDKKSLEYQVNFILNSSNEVVGDRAFNALSVGKATLGDKLLRVQDDPKSPNRQVAIFDEQIFLETKVIGRNQYLKNQSVLFIDELALQVFHNLDISRIKQVETLSKFELCKESNSKSEEFSKKKICGEQWQAIYPGPGESFEFKPIKTSHYQLVFSRRS